MVSTWGVWKASSLAGAYSWKGPSNPKELRYGGPLRKGLLGTGPTPVHVGCIPWCNRGKNSSSNMIKLAHQLSHYSKQACSPTEWLGKCFSSSTPWPRRRLAASAPPTREESPSLPSLPTRQTKCPKNLFLLLNLVVQTWKVNKKLAINHTKSSLEGGVQSSANKLNVKL